MEEEMSSLNRYPRHRGDIAFEYKSMAYIYGGFVEKEKVPDILGVAPYIVNDACNTGYFYKTVTDHIQIDRHFMKTYCKNHEEEKKLRKKTILQIIQDILDIGRF